MKVSNGKEFEMNLLGQENYETVLVINLGGFDAVLENVCGVAFIRLPVLSWRLRREEREGTVTDPRIGREFIFSPGIFILDFLALF